MGRTKKGDIGIIVNAEISIYENRVIELLHEFMNEYGITIDDIKNHYRHLMLYISKQLTIDKTRVCDIDYLLSLFMVYVNLCDIINVNPTIGFFYRLYNLENGYIKSILNNKYSNFMNICNEICKTRVIDSLSNDKGNNRNLQFIASSVYGITENNHKSGGDNTIMLSNKELAAQIGTID